MSINFWFYYFNNFMKYNGNVSKDYLLFIGILRTSWKFYNSLKETFLPYPKGFFLNKI